MICLCVLNHNISINVDLLELEDFQCRSDVGFLVDGTGSICQGTFQDGGCLNWIHTMNFLLILVRYMGLATDGTHASVALYSDTAINPYRREIRFDEFTDIDAFLDRVSDITFPDFGTTASTNALATSLTDMFNVNINGMREDVPLTLVFLTDGECRHRPPESICTEIRFQNLREDFRGREIEVIGIGVGLDENEPNDENALRQIGWLTDNVATTNDFAELYSPDFALNLDLCQGSHT